MNILILIMVAFIGFIIGEFRMALYTNLQLINYFKSTGKSERVSKEMAETVLSKHCDDKY